MGFLKYRLIRQAARKRLIWRNGKLEEVAASHWYDAMAQWDIAHGEKEEEEEEEKEEEDGRGCGCTGPLVCALFAHVQWQGRRNE